MDMRITSVAQVACTAQKQIRQQVRETKKKKPIKVTCLGCNKAHTIMVNEDDLLAYRKGMPMRKALPYLGENDRELLRSNYCSKCFSKMHS